MTEQVTEYLYIRKARCLRKMDGNLYGSGNVALFIPKVQSKYGQNPVNSLDRMNVAGISVREANVAA